MKNTYKHLDQFDRDRIEALINAGHTPEEIAGVVKVHRSTLYREIKRHKRKSGYYDATSAGHKAYVKRLRSKYQGMKVESLPEVKKHIIEELHKYRSPDEIAGRLKRELGTSIISKDAIYRWLYSVWGQRYCKLLCTKRYKPREYKKATKREMIPHRIPLCERPVEGIHWQGDIFVSPQKLKTSSSVVVLVNEKSHYLVGTKIPNRKPRTMSTKVQRLIKKIHIDTLTLDNGIENKEHELFGVPSFFCEPYSPWQKPHVECNIGLLRRWFIPKGTDLRNVSEDELQSYFKVMNGKYRKSFGYRSAYEVEASRANVIIKKYLTMFVSKLQTVALHLRI